MRSDFRRLSGLLICLPAALLCAQNAGDEAKVTISVVGRPEVTLTRKQLGSMPRHTAVLKQHDGKVSYEGVLLHEVLKQAGAPSGNDLRGKALASYVLATARDSYEVVFTLTELDPSFSDSDIILADTTAGHSLPADQGPFRIVVPNEKKGARSLRMLERLEVVQLRR